MSAVNLLFLEPDKLFEIRTVEEIGSIVSLLSKEIESKREELRTLVGERYRDLIEAADTIVKMKLLSEKVISDIEGLYGTTCNLQKNLSAVAFNRHKPSAVFQASVNDTVAAQVKLLIDLPEKIWTAIDCKDYLSAAQFFLLCRHIKTGFSVDKELNKIASELPVLEHAWSSLSHFPKTIMNSAQTSLLSYELSREDACNCLASFALLESTELASKFLKLRTEALLKSLRSEVSDDDVKLRIFESHSSIINTVLALHYCFMDNCESGGFLWKIIDSISGKNGEPVINILDLDLDKRYLPPVILQYRAHPLSKHDKIDSSGLNKFVQNWIDSVKALVQNEGKILLEKVSSLKALHALTSTPISSHSEWNMTLKAFGLGPVDLWTDLYSPLITTRAKQLISVHWQDALNDLTDEIKVVLAKKYDYQSELDLRWHVWVESSNDLIVGGDSTGMPMRGLSLKSKGISPQVAHICSVFESQLNTLYNDLASVYKTNELFTHDCGQLISHQQTACLTTILRLKDFVRDILSKSPSETSIVVLARFLQSIPILCPTLQKCLTLTDDKKGNAWAETKSLLQSESSYCWTQWQHMSKTRLLEIVKKIIKPANSLADLVNNIPQWDTVWIEESGEGGTVHKSQLKIPSCPSLPLQTLLTFIAQDVCKAHIPRTIHEQLIQKLIPEILNCCPSQTMCQAEALQYLFDVKFLMAQFVPPSEKDLYEQCTSKVSSIESKIDPFDLDVFSPHIHNNVKSSVFKYQSLVGGGVLRDSSGSTTKISEDPCLIPLSKTSTNIWFPLLPVTNPTSRNNMQYLKPKASKTVGKQISDSSAEMISKASNAASAFFTEWFS